MADYSIRYNELTAEEFISLWESVWDSPPSLEQTRLALEHTLIRISVYDDGKVIAMARANGDMGLNYYIKDVVVRPEYQHKGIGKLLINELMKFIRACSHKLYVRIFEHNFVEDEEKIRRRTRVRQGFLTKYSAKFAEKTCVTVLCEHALMITG